MTNTERIPLHKLHIGHMMRHNGIIKVVDGKSAGYRGDEWSLVVTFTDATQLVIPWPDHHVTTEIITKF